MTKNEIFARNVRALGYDGTDEQFFELAVWHRMGVRLGIVFEDVNDALIQDVARQTWAGMLDNHGYAMLN